MLRRSCDELEADFQDLGLWLGDLWTGKLSVRRAAVVASQLSPGSRVWADGDSDAMWSTHDYWMAALVEEVRANNWITANHGVEKKNHTPHPEPVVRPKDLREKAAQQAKLEINALRFQRAWRQRQSAEERKA